MGKRTLTEKLAEYDNEPKPHAAGYLMIAVVLVLALTAGAMAVYESHEAHKARVTIEGR